MQKLIAIIRKDIILRFSSPTEWLFFLILPIVFTLLISGGTGDNGDQRVRLLVADQAQSPLSAELIAAINQSDSIYTDALPLSEAEKVFADRDAPALLVIPVQFTGETLQSGSVALDFRLLPNNPAALAARQSVSAAISQISGAVRIAANSLSEAENIRPFTNQAQREAYYTEALRSARATWDAAPDRLAVTRATTPDPVAYDPRTNSSAGQIITWVFIPLLGIAGGFVYERQIGTLRRMFVSPTRKGLFLFATILGQVLMALFQIALLIGFGVFVLHVHWGSPAALSVVLAASTLAAAGMGMAMGAFIKTQGQANGVAIMAGMLMALLGGCWYPIELFPPVMQKITWVFPTRWAMQGILDVALRGKGLIEVLPVVAVLLGFALISFAIGVRRFQFE